MNNGCPIVQINHLERQVERLTEYLEAADRAQRASTQNIIECIDACRSYREEVEILRCAISYGRIGERKTMEEMLSVADGVRDKREPKEEDNEDDNQ